MNTNRILKTNSDSVQKNLNTQMITQQIESLREIMRRMKANESSSIESLINQKLKAAK